MMKFYSTNNKGLAVGLEEAVRQGLPADKGLYMPARIPQLPTAFFNQLPGLSLPEIGFAVLRPYVQAVIPDADLHRLCAAAFAFPAPLTPLDKDVFSLELYHGPTLAFKDFGARFMARLLGYFNAHSRQQNTVLVATSGDTGSAVAHGFYGVENVKVVILYPQGKISNLQERQMTTLGKNIYTLAVKGSFDDCQRLVKTAFVDRELSGQLGLTSANSINIARLLPQMLYYFYAYGQVANNRKPVVFSVPSGNYGNLTAGVLAKRMGLPIAHFIAAANANNIVPAYLDTGKFVPRPSVATISNAMDVGNPSNFVRLQELFGHSWAAFKKEITGYGFNDDQNRATIQQVFQEHGYLLDPHGAIGYRALEEYLQNNLATGVFLETAHPVKFREAVEPVTGEVLTVPSALQEIMQQQGHSTACGTDYAGFRNLLLEILSEAK